ncbi:MULTISPECIES: hypothetical protein [Micrococcaceae]|uniref:hypothetical protein n=1 Tax=Micrococcaceae TaxID=1268 RepID=UPI0011BE17E8|nr:hypothetical protein [Glutamicibacter soli]
MAIIDPASDELKLLSCQAQSGIETVDVEADAMQIGSLFARAELEVMLTCRVKYWKHSAVAHLVPSFRVRRHQDAAIRAAARHLVRHGHCGASVRRPRMIEAVPSRWNGLNSCAKQSCSGKLGRREYSWQLESPFRLSI